MVDLPADVLIEVERMGEISFVTRLAPRHREVAAFVARGYTNQEIARALELSVHTVNGYVREALLVTGARNRAQLVSVVRGKLD
ncbi:MAG: helix-turn-helix transcriptional regulator [Caldilineaceae bacterium]|nr:helix-turn-helix transcriptional regulator [Caldilineaceae bacterium]